ncbi:hypothetical protein [Nocardia asteroides]|uniref:hypothetical protein n=1 Tax=Nocardia asteroides TaxID=1824 RepID=UPI001E34C783|nr:hypothetical protein [Nocardia asteroides]UGT60886.1 hypothetical protein LTT61_27665 [Nocardia asteroides]
MTEDQAAHWRNLKHQAINGDLRLDEGVGQALAEVVDQYITALEQQKREARYLEHLTGWGTLPSAQAIRQKLEAKAVAGSAEDPDDSAINRLDQHIAIARDQRDTFLAAIGRLLSTEQQSADDLGSTGR